MDLIFFLIIIVWLSIITFFVIKTLVHYNRLARVSKGNLKEVLDKLIADLEKERIEISQIHKIIDKMKDDNRYHIQKVGIVRYNPFADTGGSQSFTVSILDENSSGLVMTSLYARTGNRWYIKKVKNGKGVEVDLSKEESESVSKAKQIV